MLPLILLVLNFLKKLLPLPDFSDKDEAHEWVKVVADLLKELAAQTPNTTDDKLAELLERVLDSDAAFDILWQLIDNLSDEPDEKSIAAMCDALPGIDPDRLKKLVQMILTILGLFI